MKVVDTHRNEIEIPLSHWPLAEDLFFKWGLLPCSDTSIIVEDLNGIALELSAWGIPWKRV